MGQRQIIGLKKIAYYVEKKQLIETKQKEMRENCLKHWDVPNTFIVLPKKPDINAKVIKLLGNSFKIDIESFTKLTKENVLNNILKQNGSSFDYLCMPCSSNDDTEPTFYLGLE